MCSSMSVLHVGDVSSSIYLFSIITHWIFLEKAKPTEQAIFERILKQPTLK